MRKYALVLTLGVLGFVPAIALGDNSPSTTSAQKQCTAEQADTSFASTHGGKTFLQYYGSNAGQQNAFGKCVSSKASASSGNSTSSTEATTTTSHVSPAAACRADRAADPTGFASKWAKKHGKGTAFGKCVAAKAAAQHTTA
jgi:hypothetical protein